MQKQSITFYFSIFFLFYKGFSQEFTEVATSINGIHDGSAEWIDYNSDGRLDLFITGYKIGDGDISHATFFENKNGILTKSDISNVPKLIRSDHAWGHLNDDGFVDFVFSGRGTSEIYLNSSGNNYTQANSSLRSVNFSDISVTDLDSDGIPEIFLYGYSSDERRHFSEIYTKKDGVYNLNQELESISKEYFGQKLSDSYQHTKGSKWHDFDNDGDVDGLISTGAYFYSQFGNFYYYGISMIENLGNLQFQSDTIDIPQYLTPSIDVFDFNNDNLLDIVISGEKIVSNTAQNSVFLTILKNEGNLRFSVLKNFELGKQIGTVDCGDFDNDGYSDILLNGFNRYEEAFLRILRNNGNSNFEMVEITNEGLQSGGAIWGDYNNDGNLDIFEYGSTSSSASDALSRLYINNNASANSPPSPPQNVQYYFDDNDLIVSWDKSKDEKMGENGLSYAVLFGNHEQNFGIIRPMSNLNGDRLINEIGNNGLKTEFKFKSLEVGTYYFQVQAIDNAFNGSTFSETIEICNPSVAMIDSVSICMSDSILLDAGNFNSYLWSSGEVTKSNYIKTEGWHSVEVENSFGCKSLDSVYVSFYPIKPINISDTLITDNDIISIDPGNYSSYLWSNGNTDRYLILDADSLEIGSNIFSLKVTDQYGCLIEGSFSVLVEDALSTPKLPKEHFSINYLNEQLILENKSNAEMHWQLYSISGKKIDGGMLSKKQQIKLQSINGVHILFINSYDDFIRKKIVLK